MSNELVVFASARALPGKERALEQALRDITKPTRAQPGCLSFQLYASEDGAMIMAVERWATKNDHERHLQGGHVCKLIAEMAEIVAGPPQISSCIALNE